ncbi:MAG: ribonuclease H-like domain-containing protein [Armatimonadetes bacterium]|nr:ribonuclease H-like domain-containing protein [Armatimonadota bacterium]
MLRSTFCHVQGIGPETERSLWDQGCYTWECLLERIDEISIGSAAKEVALRSITQSIEALDRGEHQYFRKCLGQAELWRAWADFRHSTVYLDIETDGGRQGHAVTVIGLYDGSDFSCLVKGDNLESFRDIISRYSMIVTFFGTGFDIPMLQKRFKDLEFDHLHLDLCYALKKIGFSGGLKKIEKQVGISRGGDTEGLSGLDAIRLWESYRRGSQECLNRLIAYNREDVVNLERLAEIAYKGLCERTYGAHYAPISEAAVRKASIH